MLNKINNKPVNIGILEISAQNKAILEFFFDSAGKTLFKEVSDDNSADAFIIDYDFPGAKESWKSIYVSSRKPGIILSIRETTLPSTIWVPKPITAKALTEAGQKLKMMLAENKQDKVQAAGTTNNADIPPAVEAMVNEIKINAKTDTTSKTQIGLESKVDPSQHNVASPEEQNTPVAPRATAPEESFEIPLEDSFDLTESNKTEALETEADFGLNEHLDLNKNEAKEIDPVESVNSLSDEVLDLSTPDNLLETEVNKSESIDFSDPKESVEFKKPLEPAVPHEKSEVKALYQQGESKPPKDLSESLAEINSAATEISNVELPEENSIATSNDEMDSLLESLISGKGSKSTSFDNTENSQTDLQIEKPKAPEQKAEHPPLQMEELTLEQDTDQKAEQSSDKYTEQKPDTIIEESEQRISEEVVSLPEESFSNTLLEVGDEDTMLAEQINSDSFESLVTENAQAVNEPSQDNNDLIEQANSPAIHNTNQHLDEQDIAISDSPIAETEAINPVLTDEEITRTSQENPQIANVNDTTATKPSSLTAEEELQRLLDEIRNEADGSSEVVDGDSGIEAKTSFTEKREEQIFGTWPIISKQTDLKTIAFKPEEHILHTFRQVLEQAKTSNTVMRLKLNNIIIVIDSEQEAVYCDFSLMDEGYAEICFNPVDPDAIKIHTLDKSEIRLYRKKMIEIPQNTHSYEAFIWTTSLLIARGRLPEDTNLTQKTGIRFWPNLTRLELFPNAIQISAVMKKHPGSLLEIPKWLDLPQSAVFAFYNGVLALDIIEKDQRKLKSLKGFNKKSNKKNRGFFSRLLKRIKK